MCMYIYIYIYVYIYIITCICISLSLSLYIYIYIERERDVYIYIYIERERDREKERDMVIHRCVLLWLASFRACPGSVGSAVGGLGEWPPELGLRGPRICRSTFVDPIPQHASKGGAVETGCSGLHYIIGCLII